MNDDPDLDRAMKVCPEMNSVIRCYKKMYENK